MLTVGYLGVRLSRLLCFCANWNVILPTTEKFIYFYFLVSKKHGKLITFLRTFMKSRPTKQKLKQRGILKERVFGCDLGEHLLNSGFEGKSKLFELTIPGTCGKWCVLWFSSAADAWLQSLTQLWVERRLRACLAAVLRSCKKSWHACPECSGWMNGWRKGKEFVVLLTKILEVCSLVSRLFHLITV